MTVLPLEHRLLGGFYNDTKLLKSPSNLCSRGETIVIVTDSAGCSYNDSFDPGT